MATRKSNGKTPTTQRKDFWELLGEHLSAGYVWNSPKVFMLASEARWNAEEQAFESRAIPTAGSFAWLLLLATQMLLGSFCAWRRSRINGSAGAGGNNLSPGYTAGIN
jgi:hypothetical protein